jgi:hypothetical protein
MRKPQSLALIPLLASTLLANNALAEVVDETDPTNFAGQVLDDETPPSLTAKGDRKTVNLSFNPAATIAMGVSLSAAVAITDHVAIRGDFATIYMGLFHHSTVGPTIYLNEMYSGFFVEPAIGYLGSVAFSTDVTTAQVIAGYHWMDDNSSFNVMTGIGVMAATEGHHLDHDFVPTGVLKLGWAE